VLAAPLAQMGARLKPSVPDFEDLFLVRVGAGGAAP